MIGQEVFSWIVWALSIVIENFSNTLLTRARNSGSIKRHIRCGFLSASTWFIAQIILISKVYKALFETHSVWLLVGAGLFNAVFTVVGGMIAHEWSLRTEKGNNAVGANPFARRSA